MNPIAETAIIAGIAAIWSLLWFIAGALLGCSFEPVKNHVDMTLMRIRCHRDSLDQLQRAKAASELGRTSTVDRRPSTFPVQQPKVGDA